MYHILHKKANYSSGFRENLLSEGTLYGITVWWRNEDGTYDFEQKIRDKQENIFAG